MRLSQRPFLRLFVCLFCEDSRFQVFVGKLPDTAAGRASGSMQGCGSLKVVVQQRLRLWLQWAAIGGQIGRAAECAKKQEQQQQ